LISTKKKKLPSGGPYQTFLSYHRRKKTIIHSLTSEKMQKKQGWCQTHADQGKRGDIIGGRYNDRRLSLVYCHPEKKKRKGWWRHQICIGSKKGGKRRGRSLFRLTRGGRRREVTHKNGEH